MKFCTLVVVVHFFRSASNTIDCWKKKLWDVSHFCDDRIDHHIAHSWCWTLFHFTTPKLLPYLCMRMCVLVSMIFFPKISFGINIKKKTYRLEYSLRLSSRSVSWQKAKKKGSLRWRLDGQAPCENRWKKCLATQKVVVVAHWIFPLPVAYSTHIVWYGLAVWEEELDKKKKWRSPLACILACVTGEGAERRAVLDPLCWRPLITVGNVWDCCFCRANCSRYNNVRGV